MNFPADFTFQGWGAEDSGYRLRFVCQTPGPGEASDYDVAVTDAEMAGITVQNLRTLVISRLERKVKAAAVATRLNGFIGQSVTVA